MVPAKLISAFVFATRIVQSLSYLEIKFQASIHFLRLRSLICVGPGRKPRRPVFWRRGSYSGMYTSLVTSITADQRTWPLTRYLDREGGSSNRQSTKRGHVTSICLTGSPGNNEIDFVTSLRNRYDKRTKITFWVGWKDESVSLITWRGYRPVL